MTNWHGSGGGWGVDAPVYDWDWPMTDDGATCDRHYGLPLVWVTVQQHPPTDGATGRNCICCYSHKDDPDGFMALAYGADYYEEAMACDPDDEHEKRVMCFQAAELLYLHAAKKGNPIGDLNLGYVYSYDRCEGSYWDCQAGDADERAVAHYRVAAEAGFAEACYKLGDMLRDGRGCEADLAEAFDWFCRSYELSKNDDPLVWGSVALRLGWAFEEGEGCEQSFDEALAWYKRATTGLGIAVRGGESWYKGALARAERGLARTRQELSGRY